MTIQFVHMNKINPINIAHVQHFGFHTADAERCLVFSFCPMNSSAKGFRLLNVQYNISLQILGKKIYNIYLIRQLATKE